MFHGDRRTVSRGEVAEVVDFSGELEGASHIDRACCAAVGNAAGFIVRFCLRAFEPVFDAVVAVFGSGLAGPHGRQREVRRFFRDSSRGTAIAHLRFARWSQIHAFYACVVADNEFAVRASLRQHRCVVGHFHAFEPEQAVDGQQQWGRDPGLEANRGFDAADAAFRGDTALHVAGYGGRCAPGARFSGFERDCRPVAEARLVAQALAIVLARRVGGFDDFAFVDALCSRRAELAQPIARDVLARFGGLELGLGAAVSRGRGGGLGRDHDRGARQHRDDEQDDDRARQGEAAVCGEALVEGA